MSERSWLGRQMQSPEGTVRYRTVVRAADVRPGDKLEVRFDGRTRPDYLPVSGVAATVVVGAARFTFAADEAVAVLREEPDPSDGG